MDMDFMCELCGSKIRSKNLKAHKRVVHEKYKPYKCESETCKVKITKDIFFEKFV